VTLEERIAKLEDDLANRKQKDRWDKFSIITAALIPVAIGGAGVLYSSVTTRAANIRADSEERTRQLEWQAESRIKQAELVERFFEPLMGGDTKRSAFAVEALLIAASEYGPTLVRVFAGSNTTAEADYAANALDVRRDLLIRQMFSDVAEQRMQGYQQLLTSWGSEESLIPAVIAFGRTNQKNLNGIYNAMVLLSHMQREVIQGRRAEIFEFITLVEGLGDKIRERANVLRSRL
jgi:hypothetical protein